MKHSLILLGCLVLILGGCAVQQPLSPIIVEEPQIRVGIVWGIPSIDFTADTDFRITNHDGSFIARGLKGSLWRAEVETSSPADINYILVAASMSTEERARDHARDLKKQGFDTVIQPIGQQTRINGRVVNDNRKYRVCLKKAFHSEEAARRYQETIQDRLTTFVTTYKRRAAQGTIKLKNVSNGQTFESTKPILLSGSPVTLYDVPVGVGFHWGKEENRTYPETVAFQLDNDGALAVINILPIEEYLKGVVPSEMPHGFPSEALKAQAVAARGEMLSKLGIVHRSDPFDICADVHCQAYSGLSKRAPSTDQAVRETRGLVLWKDEHICDAVYSSVCGGHGEDADIVWGGEPQSYLKGNVDGPPRLKRYGDLSKEAHVKRWIDDSPPAYCNTTRGAASPALDYTKKYFRWEVRYTQDELREIVRQKTGRDVGPILDIVPLARGRSGRIAKLDIQGRDGDIRVERELEIRRTLSPNTLWSACFYVEKRGHRSQAPAEFILHGAGWGHGVGMCQTGAAMMGLQGFRFDDILKHYYKGVRIRRLY